MTAMMMDGAPGHQRQHVSIIDDVNVLRRPQRGEDGGRRYASTCVSVAKQIPQNIIAICIPFQPFKVTISNLVSFLLRVVRVEKHSLLGEQCRTPILCEKILYLCVVRNG